MTEQLVIPSDGPDCIYYYDGPCMFLTEHLGHRSLFVLYERGDIGDDYIAVPISSEVETALIESRISILGAMLSTGRMRTVYIRPAGTFISIRAVPHDLEHLYPDPGIGLAVGSRNLPNYIPTTAYPGKYPGYDAEEVEGVYRHAWTRLQARDEESVGTPSD